MKNFFTNHIKTILLIFSGVILFPTMVIGNNTSVPSIVSIRLEFIFFALTLIGVAIFHKKTMYVALIGLIVIVIFKSIFDTHFSLIHHIFGTNNESGEWRMLLNLLGLLFGFAILAKHFKASKIPDILPKYLPHDWKGPLLLLLFVMILSSFLDNIAAAIIGGTIAMVVFRGNVHIGFLAAIIAASNAGGAGSVLGDTTTTLMWIDGVSPFDVVHAFVGSFFAFIIFGYWGSIQQNRFQPVIKATSLNIKIDWRRIIIVLLILIGAIATNILFDFPALGVWVAIIIGAFIRKTDWSVMKNSLNGTIFLLALVTCASLMPVEDLPKASWQSAFALGFISAVFDNIPLTKLCLDQGGYDWGILAYTVGFGGSMIWFGSSAGVALSNMYPETRDSIEFIKKGWHVIIAYIISFFIMLALVGWHPHAPHKNKNIIENNTDIEYSPNGPIIF